MGADQLLDLLLLIVAGDTMRDMIAEHLLLHLVQGSAHRVNLREDVHAVAVILDHAREPADPAYVVDGQLIRQSQWF
jgi:hypothetical protein